VEKLLGSGTVQCGQTGKKSISSLRANEGIEDSHKGDKGGAEKEVALVRHSETENPWTRNLGLNETVFFRSKELRNGLEGRIKASGGLERREGGIFEHSGVSDGEGRSELKKIRIVQSFYDSKGVRGRSGADSIYWGGGGSTQTTRRIEGDTEAIAEDLRHASHFSDGKELGTKQAKIRSGGGGKRSKRGGKKNHPLCSKNLRLLRHKKLNVLRKFDIEKAMSTGGGRRVAVVKNEQGAIWGGSSNLPTLPT